MLLAADYPFLDIVFTMIIFFVICYPVARGVDRTYRRLAHLGSS